MENIFKFCNINGHIHKQHVEYFLYKKHLRVAQQLRLMNVPNKLHRIGNFVLSFLRHYSKEIQMYANIKHTM